MLSFKDLVVWQRSHLLTLEIYEVTQCFPKEEIFGLTSQIRRAVSSIPTNIAEGCGRRTNAELANFLNIASGSASEVEYEILLAKEVGYISTEQFDKENVFANVGVCNVKKLCFVIAFSASKGV